MAGSRGRTHLPRGEARAGGRPGRRGIGQRGARRPQRWMRHADRRAAGDRGRRGAKTFVANGNPPRSSPITPVRTARRRPAAKAVAASGARRPAALSCLARPLRPKIFSPLMFGVPNRGSSVSTKQKQPCTGTLSLISATTAVTSSTCFASPSTSSVWSRPATFSTGLLQQRRGDVERALVALGGDDPDAGRGHRDVVDVRAGAGDAPVVQDRHGGAVLGQRAARRAPRRRRRAPSFARACGVVLQREDDAADARMTLRGRGPRDLALRRSPSRRALAPALPSVAVRSVTRRGYGTHAA